MERTDTDPDDYLASLDDRHADMVALDALIRDCLPGRNRTVWEGTFWGGTEQTIIGYGDIVQPRPKGPDVEWFLVGLARQKTHCSVYVNAAEDGQYLLRAYEDRLGRVKVGSAAINVASMDRLDEVGFRALLEHAHRIG